MSEAKRSDVWGLAEMLTEMSRRFPNLHQLPRAWAAEVLEAAGENISWGNGDFGYSPREIGWALVRVFGTHSQVPLEELVTGYKEALAYYADGSVPDDLQR